MILLSPDAVEDVERLRTFLDQRNPDAARRALALIWTAIEQLQEFPDLGMRTEDAEIRQIVGTAVRQGPELALRRTRSLNPSHKLTASGTPVHGLARERNLETRAATKQPDGQIFA
jgi:hypothetical protein